MGEVISAEEWLNQPCDRCCKCSDCLGGTYQFECSNGCLKTFAIIDISDYNIVGGMSSQVLGGISNVWEITETCVMEPAVFDGTEFCMDSAGGFGESRKKRIGQVMVTCTQSITATGTGPAPALQPPKMYCLPVMFEYNNSGLTGNGGVSFYIGPGFVNASPILSSFYAMRIFSSGPWPTQCESVVLDAADYPPDPSQAGQVPFVSVDTGTIKFRPACCPPPCVPAPQCAGQTEGWPFEIGFQNSDLAKSCGCNGTADKFQVTFSDLELCPDYSDPGLFCFPFDPPPAPEVCFGEVRTLLLSNFSVCVDVTDIGNQSIEIPNAIQVDTYDVDFLTGQQIITTTFLPIRLIAWLQNPGRGHIRLIIPGDFGDYEGLFHGEFANCCSDFLAGATRTSINYNQCGQPLNPSETVIGFNGTVTVTACCGDSAERTTMVTL